MIPVPPRDRIRGQNPPYAGAYWLTNDLPCFGPDAPPPPDGDDLYQTRPARGTAEVVCYHPDHRKTFVDLTDDEARAVVDLWAERYKVLGSRPEVEHVLIFENRGSRVGTSNPHPHCQIYAGNLIYAHIARGRERASSSSARGSSSARRPSGARRPGRASSPSTTASWPARLIARVRLRHPPSQSEFGLGILVD
jgi:galactose-1-phosphate uridylyltransferase